MSRRGILLMLLSAICFCLVQSVVKFMGPAVDSWAKAFFRGVFGFAALVLWLFISKKKLSFNNKKILFVRAITGSIALVLSFWNIDLLGLSLANLYLYTYLVFAPLFSSLLYKEKFDLWKIWPLLLSLFGIYFLQGADINHFDTNHLFGILSGISAGVAISSVRHLRKTENTESILFVFISLASLFVALAVFINPTQSLDFNRISNYSEVMIWGLLILLGVSATGGQLFMTQAYRHLDTVTGSIMALLNIPMVALIAIVFFQESFSLIQIIGGILIFISTLWISLYKKPSPDKINDNVNI